MASRLEDLNSVEQFIEDQENENTRKKTQQNVALLKEFLTLRKELRLIEEIPPKELNVEFIITVRKKDSNEDYEPSSLLSLMASFERYSVRKKNYGFSIMKDAEFEQPRKAIKTEKDPVAAYKLYAKKPTEMNDSDAPFYLAVNNCTKQESSKLWFKTSAVGQRKLNTLTRKMEEKAGLGANVKNHSGRKTMIHSLTNSYIPATDIIQLSGHKNLQSVTNYSVVPEKQQIKMSHTFE